mmetsp:Transcript_16624/g.29688  ORF Transcript_16624/g.29688 Transcript_16624/m.29688 type:complete len:288 (-) Transcript_16624:184-1047(-)
MGGITSSPPAGARGATVVSRKRFASTSFHLNAPVLVSWAHLVRSPFTICSTHSCPTTTQASVRLMAYCSRSRANSSMSKSGPGCSGNRAETANTWTICLYRGTRNSRWNWRCWWARSSRSAFMAGSSSSGPSSAAACSGVHRWCESRLYQKSRAASPSSTFWTEIISSAASLTPSSSGCRSGLLAYRKLGKWTSPISPSSRLRALQYSRRSRESRLIWRMVCARRTTASKAQARIGSVVQSNSSVSPKTCDTTSALTLHTSRSVDASRSKARCRRGFVARRWRNGCW